MTTASHDLLHTELKSLVANLRNAELRLARALAEMKATRGYVHFASSMTEYMDDWLHLDGEKARKLLKIGEALPRLPLLSAAMADHSVSWTKAFQVSRVATPKTEASWVEKAREWPVRKLRLAVCSSAPGQDAPDDVEPSATVVFRFELSQASAERVRKAAALARGLAPEDGPDLEDAEILELFAEAFSVQAAKDERHLNPARFKTIVRECPSCGASELAGVPPGHDVMADEVAHEMAGCDSEVIDFGPRGNGGSYHTVAPRLKRACFERADYRCQTPGCRHRIFLDVHHVHHRAHGGANSFENCIVLCSVCHARVHAGVLFVEPAGSGSFSFSWTRARGVASGRPPSRELQHGANDMRGSKRRDLPRILMKPTG